MKDNAHDKTFEVIFIVGEKKKKSKKQYTEKHENMAVYKH